MIFFLNPARFSILNQANCSPRSPHMCTFTLQVNVCFFFFFNVCIRNQQKCMLMGWKKKKWKCWNRYLYDTIYEVMCIMYKLRFCCCKSLHTLLTLCTWVIPEESDPTSVPQVTVSWTVLWLHDSVCLSKGIGITSYKKITLKQQKFL